MASYADVVKSARMQAIIDALDGKLEQAYMEIGTADLALVLVTITLDDPSFVEQNAVITMQGMPKSGMATRAGTAVEARIRDGDGEFIVNGLTVGTANADIVLDFVDLAEGQSITLAQAAIAHSP